MKPREHVQDLEAALAAERAENERLREALAATEPVTFHEVPADMLYAADAVDRRLAELEAPSPATGYAAPTPIEPCDDWERRRAAWHPGGLHVGTTSFDLKCEDDLPRKRSALREIILEQRVQLEELRDRCDAYMNELEGWRAEAKREAHDGDVDRAVADSHLEHARHLDERCRDLEEVAEARGSALAAAEALLKRQADRIAELEACIAELRARNDDYGEAPTGDYSITQGETQPLVDRVAELEGERDALGRDLDRYGPLLAAANERIERLEGIGQSIRAALPDDLAAMPLDACVIELVRRIRDLEAGPHVRRGALVAAQHRIAELEAERDRAIRELETANRHVIELEAEREQAPPLGSRDMANLEIDRDGWRSRAQVLQARVNELEATISAAIAVDDHGGLS